MRKLVIFIACSVDGYIAKTNDDLSFLSMVEKEGEDYGYGEFIKTIDTIILGRNTYNWVTKNVPTHYGDKRTIVITHEQKQPEGNISFYSGSLPELVHRLKQEPGKNIFCDGGANIIKQLLQEDLVDEFTISLIPVLLGEGTRLFQDGRPELKLQLETTKAFDTGLVQLVYKRKR
jgi:dihydrofolate reductase